jgi:Na+/H+ antiporter NhaD/arsenite permease-like protein
MIPAILSSIVFLATLILIFTEKLNRVIASTIGAVIMVILGLFFNFYDESQALASVDFNTAGLLLGMMVIVAILEPTGFFQYLAISVSKQSKGKPFRLLVLLGAITTVISMFLDNVTTVVLIAPVTILICEILGLSPLPYLMAEALLSDTGGIATLIGDPPNIIIGSAAGFTFIDFLTHSLPIIAVVWFVALLILRLLFTKELSAKPSNLETLQDLNPKNALNDPKSAKKVIIVISIAILFFFLEELLAIKPSLVALGAAAVILVWVRPPIQETLKRVHWDVLIFFIALFILIGGLEASGVMGLLAKQIALAGNLPPILFSLILLWGVAILSALVDNVPITIALIPIIQGLGGTGIPIEPLWWALVFGAGLGGNGTIIGSTANIVVASVSEKTGTPITPKLWNRYGLPVMLGTLLVASILYVVFYYLVY